MRSLITYIVFAMVMASCATVGPVFKEPSASVDNVEFTGFEGLSPTFKILLTIKNPNPFGLPVAGLDYQFNIEGAEIFSGFTNDIGTIPSYGATPVEIDGKANILNSTLIAQELMQTNRNDINYLLSAKVDFQGLWPSLSFDKSGALSIRGQ